MKNNIMQESASHKIATPKPRKGLEEIQKYPSHRRNRLHTHSPNA